MTTTASVEELPLDLATSMSSSFQHINLIRAKESRLVDAREQALRQMLHRVGSDYRTGRLTHRQLCLALIAVREQRITGSMNAWDEIVGVSWKRTLHLAKQLPNGPEGSWVGEYPLPLGAVAPISGIPVVYVLFDERNQPCYVGSTDKFRHRMGSHEKSGKQFIRWQAHPCDDRDHAYRLEDRLLKQHKPYLNQKAGR